MEQKAIIQTKDALNMLRRFPRLAIVLAIVVLTVPSRAAMEPANVAAELDFAAKTCREMGGIPSTRAMLTVHDLNGDGSEDWIVDYKKFICLGTINPFCGTGGCSLQIFLSSTGSSWTLAFDEVLHRYKFTLVNGKRTMKVQFGGAACNKTNSRACAKNYEIEQERIVPVK